MNLKDLESRFRGELLTAGSEAYEASRKDLELHDRSAARGHRALPYA
jgi:hypothetical protein